MQTLSELIHLYIPDLMLSGKNYQYVLKWKNLNRFYVPSIGITGHFIYCLRSFALRIHAFDVIKELTEDIHMLFENTLGSNTNAWYHVSSLKKGLISTCWYDYKFILLILICKH